MKREVSSPICKDEFFPTPKDKIILALNTSDFVRAHCLVTLLSGHVGYFKFGHELISAMLASLLGPSERVATDNLVKIRAIFDEAKDRIFLDGRFAGTASVVGPTVKIFSDLGVSMMSVQVGQGINSVMAAIENKGKSLLFAATPMSSASNDECCKQVRRMPHKDVQKLAAMAGGLDGIICSSFETSTIRELFPRSLIVTRDVAPIWFSILGRKKVITPREAITAGADAIIVGKPISQPLAGGPTQAAEQIAQEIEEALYALKKDSS